jgi:hypothetical protein
MIHIYMYYLMHSHLSIVTTEIGHPHISRYCSRLNLMRLLIHQCISIYSSHYRSLKKQARSCSPYITTDVKCKCVLLKIKDFATTRVEIRQVLNQYNKVRTKLAESPWMSLNLRTKIQGLECPWICKEVLECPWILLALVFGYFLKLFDFETDFACSYLTSLRHYKVTFWTIQRHILLISNASSVFSPWICWYMALNVLEKSLNLTLPDMYEPWYKLSSGGGVGGGGGGLVPTKGHRSKCRILPWSTLYFSGSCIPTNESFGWQIWFEKFWLNGSFAL